MISTTESSRLLPAIRQEGEKDDDSPGTESSRLSQQDRAQAATEIFITLPSFSSLCYTFRADLHAFKNLLVQPADCLVAGLKEQQVRAVKAQMCSELGKNSGLLQPKLVRQSTHAVCPTA